MRRYRTRQSRKKKKREFRTSGRSYQTFDQHLNRAILKSLFLAEKPYSLNELLSSLDLPRSAKNRVEDALEFLVSKKEIRKSGKRSYALMSPHQYSEATLEKHPRGFGFATDIQAKHLRKRLEKDPFISASRVATARHQDRILIKIFESGRNGRREAEVIGVLARGRNRLAGLYFGGFQHGLVHPDDPRDPAQIIIRKPSPEPVKEGDAVFVAIHEEETPERLYGEIVEVLGDPTTARVQGW